MRKFTTLAKTLLVGAIFTGTVYCAENRTPVWVLGWGSNRNGELGIGSNLNSTIPKRLATQFKDISAKKSVSAGIGADGRVYVWGKVWKGLLAEGANTNCLLPTEVELLPPGRYKQVECTQNGLCVVSEEGEIYEWKFESAEGGFRTLGQDNIERERRGFGRIHGLSRVKQVACSVDHTVALTEDGEVFSWGKYEKRLGRKGNPHLPLKVSLPFISKVSAGSDFMLAIDTEGRIFCWGNNNFGELGLPDLKFALTPQLMRTLEHERIYDISCGNSHVAAITNQGDVYTWGFGNQGQLGHGDKVDQHIPRKLEVLSQVNQVACGGGHTVFVTSKNEVYTTGRGREGQSGIEEKDQSSHGLSLRPRPVQSITSHLIRKIVCGDNHTFALLSTQKI